MAASSDRASSAAYSDVYEIYDRWTGETIESGYTKRAAHNAIAWCWNTGGEVSHMAVRRDPTIAVPPSLIAAAAHMREVEHVEG